MSARAHISRLERDGAAAAGGARCLHRGARRRPAIRRRRMPKAGARAPSWRMRASRLPRWSAPSRPRWCSPAAARKPTTAVLRCADGTTIVLSGDRARFGAGAGPRRSGARSSRCRSGANGVVRVEVAGDMLTRRARAVALLSLQMANNETGVIQPVAEVAAAAEAHGVLVHTDAVQAAGRIAVDLARARRRLPGAVRPQDRRPERRRRAGHPRGVQSAAASLPAAGRSGAAARGTENVAAIAGFGAAAEAAQRELARVARMQPRCATGWRPECARITPAAVDRRRARRRACPTRRASRCRAAAPRRW